MQEVTHIMTPGLPGLMGMPFSLLRSNIGLIPGGTSGELEILINT